MPLKVDYVLRETGSNLRRNLTLTLASVLTVVVSLTLVGIALLIRQGVSNATQRWRSGVELIVFMEPNVQPAQRDAVQRALKENPEVKRFDYVNKNQAYEEFKKLFKDSPDMVSTVSPDILPTSFTVVPLNADFDSVSALKRQYEGRPGVREVVSADETIKTMQAVTRKVSAGVLIAAVVLLGTAAMLIFNTIRMAMFARRREIEVMKLVGATNWFIRVPFMLEGLVQGLVGAGLAIGALFVYNHFMTTQLQGQQFSFFKSFVTGSSDVVVASLFIAAVGALVGMIGSGLAASRFLDV